jgi:hypothetical protein
VIDNQLSRWNLATAPGPAPGPYTDVYRNGVQRFDQGIGSQILWHAGNIYIKGDDDLWYYWTNGQYVGNVGAVDPGVPAVPDLPPAVSQVWSLTSGPGLVVWSAQTALQTTATFSQPGTYVVRLTASDSLAMGFDETTVTVQAVPVSPSLVVSARVTKCQLSVSAQAPPDTQAGWTYQVRYGTGTAPPTVNFGRADTKAPYLATGTLDPGTYTFAATWTRPNTPSVTTPTQPGACQ